MEIADHIETLEREGALLADAAAAGSLDDPIPTCPGWTIRDLVRHTGGVHRWATGYVAERRTEPWDVDLDEVVGSWPGDRGLLDWFRQGHARLIEALRAAPPDLECFTFLAAPSPLAMWARRQAHETTIHRVDAESARGPLSVIAPAMGADGIDELVSCFITRRRRGPTLAEPTSLLIELDDTGDVWHVQLDPDGVTTTRGRAPSACRVSGRAADTYLLLWNRRDTDGIAVAGDAAVLDLWRDGVRIRWS